MSVCAHAWVSLQAHRDARHTDATKRHNIGQAREQDDVKNYAVEETQTVDQAREQDDEKKRRF